MGCKPGVWYLQIPKILADEMKVHAIRESHAEKKNSAATSKVNGLHDDY
jgi:hypothetical protein